MAKKTRHELRLARHARLRKRVTGTPEKPRLSVYRSLKHISAQISDDTWSNTGPVRKMMRSLSRRE